MSPRSDEIGTDQIINLKNGSELIYIPRFLRSDESWSWFNYLDKEIPWTRPSICVMGRCCVQPRDTCYIASSGLPDYKYSGYQPHAYSWHDFPILNRILENVQDAIPDSNFNSLLLNRYRGGSDYVGWHADNEKLYGPTPQIASLSLGCERVFLIKKRPIKASKGKGSGEGVCAEAQRLKGRCTEKHSFLLKHGSLLVMRGYTQRDWIHSVPKRANTDAVRINLTFRYIPQLKEVRTKGTTEMN